MFQRELCHIYGPFSIYSYGVACAIAVVVYSILISRDWRFAKLKLEPFFYEMVSVGIIAAIVGARILFIITEWQTFTEWQDLFKLWEGGLSILGGIIGVGLVIGWYLYRYQVPIIPTFDLLALYAPILQAIGRLGCLWAGCCFGKPSTASWAITYTDPNSMASTLIALHPAQLYSALMLCGIFILMYFILQKWFKKPGQLAAIYLILAGIERFANDFWRADQAYFVCKQLQFMCANQLIALGMMAVGILALLYVSILKTNRYE